MILVLFCLILDCPVGVHVDNVQCCSLYIFMYCVRALCNTKSYYYYHVMYVMF